MGEELFFRIVKDVVYALGLRGCGARKELTMHSLRARTVTLLLKAATRTRPLL